VVDVHRRPELNGIHGQVVDEAVDAFGRVVIRVRSQEVEGPRHLKVHVCRLRPIPSPSTPSAPSVASAEGRPCSVGRHRAEEQTGACALEWSQRSASSPQLAAKAVLSGACARSSLSAQVESTCKGISGIASQVSNRSPSLSSSAYASEILKVSADAVPNLSGKRQLFKAQRSAFKRGYLPMLLPEQGDRPYHGLHSTDATQFEADFCAVTGGVPLHKAYPKEEAVLRNPRTNMLEPCWSP